MTTFTLCPNCNEEIIVTRELGSGETVKCYECGFRFYPVLNPVIEDEIDDGEDEA